MTPEEVRTALPIGSRWKSNRSGTVATVIRYVQSDDGVFRVRLASWPSGSSSAWNPEVVLRNRTRVSKPHAVGLDFDWEDVS